MNECKKNNFIAFTFLLLSACDALESGDDNYMCPAVIHPAVRVTLYDEASGNPLCGASGILIDGAFSEDLIVYEGDDCSSAILQGGDERPGTYQVVISKQGYETWSSDEFVVSEGRCGVSTKTFDVYLGTL